jgi:hypothetical protein
MAAAGAGLIQRAWAAGLGAATTLLEFVVQTQVQKAAVLACVLANEQASPTWSPPVRRGSQPGSDLTRRRPTSGAQWLYSTPTQGPAYELAHGQLSVSGIEQKRSFSDEL